MAHSENSVDGTLSHWFCVNVYKQTWSVCLRRCTRAEGAGHKGRAQPFKARDMNGYVDPMDHQPSFSKQSVTRYYRSSHQGHAGHPKTNGRHHKAITWSGAVAAKNV